MESASAHPPELLNLVSLFREFLPAQSPWQGRLHQWENAIFTGIIVAGFFLFARLSVGRTQLIPGRWQALAEMIVESLESFVTGILGEAGRRYAPFIATLFLYIFVNNFLGLIFLMKSPTSSWTTTLPMALCVFLYVQWVGIRASGVLGYLDHMAGNPRGLLGWLLVPLMLPIHVLGEFLKPLSLTLRLYINIFAEDLLLAVFAGLGLSSLAFLHLPIGLPLHTPFMFLAMVTGTIQAFVFALLSTVYIALMLPHEEHAQAH